MTRAKDISKILTDADISGTLDVTGAITSSAGATITTADNTAQLTLKSTDADSSTGPVLDLTRDSASPADGDSVGEIVFKADDDAGNSTEFASIQTKISDASDGAESGKIEISTIVAGTLRKMINIKSNEVSVNEDGVDVDFRVESNGNANMLFVDGGNNNVAIGHTTTGGANLAICDGANSAIQFYCEIATDTNLIQHYDQTATAYMNARYSGATHQFLIGTSEFMNISANGRGNFNTDADLAQVNIASPNLAASADTLRLINKVNNTGGYFIRFVNSSGGAAGYIEQTGSTSVSYSTSSDYRLKENVSVMTDATTRLKQLKPKRFNFITEPDTTLDGFLAHEVESVVPEAISGTHNGLEVWKEGEELPDGISVGDNKLDADGNTIPIMQGIDQSKLVPLLVKTIQELEARITALESA